MKDLILKDKTGRKVITVGDFSDGLLIYVEVEDTLTDYSECGYVTPSQTRELIAHLTNCLKEVEGEQECDHPFASVMSKCNGEINHCLKCGEKF